MPETAAMKRIARKVVKEIRRVYGPFVSAAALTEVVSAGGKDELEKECEQQFWQGFAVATRTLEEMQG